MVYIAYNTHAGHQTGRAAAEKAAALFERRDTTLRELNSLDAALFLCTLTAADTLVLCGGDGTLNRFANDTYGMHYPCDIWLYPAGTGNDFLRDMEGYARNGMVRVNDHLTNLPAVTVNGVTRRYINGIGYGIDGMVVEKADELLAQGKQRINYAALSVKLLLSGYDCPNATVTVDGVTKSYRKVWLASSMNGKYYGGGMKVAPAQNRRSGRLSLVMMHGTGKLKTLRIFPGIFKGQHITHREAVEVLRGNAITVTFDRPMPLQIDGELWKDVTSYSVLLGEPVAKEEAAVE